MGSPPRVREKPDREGERIAYSRITPACARKIESSLLQSKFDWDHPRVCGKNDVERDGLQDTPGSPPRVREKLETTTDTQETEGITPASAGKTHSL